MDYQHLWHEAASLAARAHEHQYRRDGETPYAAHTSRVALVVAAVFGVTDEAILAAAFLHDVIEDTGIDFEDLEEICDREVAGIVVAMSKDMRVPEDEREILYDRQLAEGPWQARLIKLADVYDNLSDARTDWGRRKIIAKAERALKLAGGDARLAEACDRLRDLVRRVEISMGTEPAAASE